MFYIGVDPGISGAAVCIDHDRQFIDQVMFSKSTDADIADFFREFGKDAIVVLESVHAMPKQGVVSSFKFGGAFRFVQGVMVALGVAFELCRPQIWQKALQVPPRKGKSQTEHKRVLKNTACQLFAGQGIVIVKENADALLIAEYCRQKYGGRQMGTRL